MHIQLIPTHQLRWHPVVKHLPIMEEAVTEARERLAEHGFIEPLKACTRGGNAETGPVGYYLLDGRHRHRAAEQLGLTEVPVTLHDEGEASSIALQCLLGRNHFTKGQIAYYAVPCIEAQLARPGGNGSNQYSKPQLSGGLLKTRDELCAEFHISCELFRQARQVHQIFEEDPDYADDQLPKLFAREKPSSLGDILAGYGGRNATKDAKQQPLKHVVNRTCLASGTWKRTFAIWSAIAPAEKSIIRTEWGRLLGLLPEELRNVRPIKSASELED